ncbi:unnamed protein product, partial [Rotaria magnacalcarata]
FKLLSDTFHMAIHLIDRYLQIVDVSKHELQLIGSTDAFMSVILSNSLEENHWRKILFSTIYK